ncbi:unnamed protein product [Lactuca saligna]|uniref:Uncharacterized protein n=1 Tax=Lactuca saligna TaxID=75948 RepID=A0AA35YX94_LACSI|nr:unnamed protein product [Lactuca saligna]
MDPKLPPMVVGGGKNVQGATPTLAEEEQGRFTTPTRAAMEGAPSSLGKEATVAVLRIVAASVVYFRSFTALLAAADDGMMSFTDGVVGGTGLSGLVTQMVVEEAPMVETNTGMKEIAAVVLALGLGFEPLNTRLHT